MFHFSVLFCAVQVNWLSQPKMRGINHLSLNGQNYFVWYNSSQSRNWQFYVRNLGSSFPWPFPGYAYIYIHKGSLVKNTFTA